MWRYIAVLVFCTYNFSFGLPPSKNPITFSQRLSKECGDSEILKIPEISSEIISCDKVINKVTQKEHALCLMFYDINTQICTAEKNLNSTSLDENLHSFIEKDIKIEDVCSKSYTFQDLPEFPAYKNITASFNKTSSCILLCANLGGELTVEANFFCKYLYWSSTIIKKPEGKTKGTEEVVHTGVSQVGKIDVKPNFSNAAVLSQGETAPNEDKKPLVHNIQLDHNPPHVNLLKPRGQNIDPNPKKVIVDETALTKPEVDPLINVVNQNINRNKVQEEEEAKSDFSEPKTDLSKPKLDLSESNPDFSKTKPDFSASGKGNGNPDMSGFNEDQTLHLNTQESASTKHLADKLLELTNGKPPTTGVEHLNVKSKDASHTPVSPDKKPTSGGDVLPPTDVLSTQNDNQQKSDDTLDPEYKDDDENLQIGDGVEIPQDQSAKDSEDQAFVVNGGFDKATGQVSMPFRKDPVSDPYPSEREIYEDGGDNFFPFFLSAIALVALMYILYHNKNRLSKLILGLLVEGRQNGGRRRNSRGHAYRRLDTLEQAMSTNTSAPPSKIIY